MKIESYKFPGSCDLNLDEILCFKGLNHCIIIVIDPFNDENFNKEDHSSFLSNLRLTQQPTPSFEKALKYILTYDGETKYSIALLSIKNNIVEYFNVGDCRIYVSGKLITTDHSSAWIAIDKKWHKNIIGGLCINHSQQSFLYRYLPNIGVPVTYAMKVCKGDIIHVATDGFWSIHHYEIIRNETLLLDMEKYKDNASVITIYN